MLNSLLIKFNSKKIFNYYIMPIGFEVNDYDSDDDISSTEDETIDLPINNKNNKKNKNNKN